MVIYICIEFQENISNSSQVTEWTQINHYVQSSKGHNLKSRVTKVMVLVFCISSQNALHLCEVSSKYLEQFHITEWTHVHSRNGYFQYLLCSKGATPKVGLPELWFLCSAHCLIVLLLFLRNFIIISLTVFNFQSGHEYMVELAIFNVQRAIIAKEGKQSYGSCVLQVVS